MKNILRKFLANLGKTISNGKKKDGSSTGVKNIANNSPDSSQYKIEVKEVKIKKLTIDI